MVREVQPSRDVARKFRFGAYIFFIRKRGVRAMPLAGSRCGSSLGWGVWGGFAHQTLTTYK
jgi:hypothetical protein